MSQNSSQTTYASCGTEYGNGCEESGEDLGESSLQEVYAGSDNNLNGNAVYGRKDKKTEYCDTYYGQMDGNDIYGDSGDSDATILRLPHPIKPRLSPITIDPSKKGNEHEYLNPKPAKPVIIDPSRKNGKFALKQPENNFEKPADVIRKNSLPISPLTYVDPRKLLPSPGTTDTKDKRKHSHAKKHSVGRDPDHDLKKTGYFQELSRDEAEKQLRANGKEGQFIVRPSSEKDGLNFALSFYSDTIGNKVNHVKISYLAEEHKWILGTDKSCIDRFSKVTDLCDMYIQNGIKTEGHPVALQLSKPLKIAKRRNSLF